MTAPVQIEGLAALEDRFARMLKDLPGISERALEDCAEDLKGRSQRLAPIDTGDLRGSAYARREGEGWVVGFEEPYALIQHERLDYNHPKGGQAKYLEGPFNEQLPSYVRHIAESVGKGL